VYVLGGPGAVPSALDAALAEYASKGVVRLQGADRYATAVDTSAHLWPSGSRNVTIARGDEFPDALSAATILPAVPGPVLLSSPSGLDASTLEEIRRLKPANAFIIGGTGVVPDSVSTEFSALGVAVFRLAGPDRYATSLELARTTYPTAASTVFLATGEDFPDGLVVGPAAARASGPILLTPPTCMPIRTAVYLNKVKPQRIVLVGGASVLSDDAGRLRVC